MLKGLYQPSFEKDSCGFGLIAQMDGKPSHWLVSTAILSLTHLTHRGAIAADGKTGDGCGLLLKKPDSFFSIIAQELGYKLAPLYAVGMVFLHQQAELATYGQDLLKEKLQAQGLEVLGWREVPLNTAACGEEALKTIPQIKQIFINAPANLSEAEFERKLYLARRATEKIVKANDNDKSFYLPSLSSRVISYKGLVMPDRLPQFYLDLNDERFASALCVYHQRFSTNTWPQWWLAQPFRYLAHNGEINTIQGNRNWAVARSHKFASDLIDIREISPLVSMSGSDSCSLDNMLEALLAGGMDVFRAMRLLVPPAWQNVDTMDPELRAFYEYSSMHMEPWDGPAGIVLTDGRYAACVLDRNGLRPARYVVTSDRHITLASEVGVYDYANAEVVQKGRLKPGDMIAVDTEHGKLLLPKDIEDMLKTRQPYKKWLRQQAKFLEDEFNDHHPYVASLDEAQLAIHQKQYQVTFEELDQVIRVLAETGEEATASMGDDTPLAVLSRGIRSPYDYFRQQFAQVTNPAIDPLREKIVMSLRSCFGREMNMFVETPEHAMRLEISSPVLSPDQFVRLLNLTDNAYSSAVLDLQYAIDLDLKTAILQLCDRAVELVKSGTVILVLSDKNLSREKLPIHAAFAVGAVHHRLIAEGLRCDANLVVETATARDSHHFAVLIGYGATAVYPYLAYDSVLDLVKSGNIKHADNYKAVKKYQRGIEKGLYKIISKMGISTITSYRGAQLFEAVGIHREVVDLCFKATTCRIQGSNFADFKADNLALHRQAWTARKLVKTGGLFKYIHGGEYHAYNPDVIKTIQEAVKTGDYSLYQQFANLVNQRAPSSLRDMFTLRSTTAIPIDEVEPISQICRRFDSAAMSLGALSPEAHEALAIAMNRLGGRSNSGEGGEDVARYGTERMSKIKQIASGRFGVTPHYLVNAEVLQIKVAQGAKPGEGGQLPGGKVTELIAKLRYSVPGVTLISPPPHHDIYSIEDLAQLIFDLKQVNPQALVSVKLVAEAGVGTVAAGVAKAYADLITIAGYDGGTGASPLTSIKYAGSPWELGLTETHQVLRANNLRDKVRLQTDGGLKTGLDVVKAAIFGAESFGFGTAPMVALGCKYLRICHLNNCATGVATQNKILRREHFVGLPEMVMNYFIFVATETREIMAQLGIRNFEELIGRTDLLQPIAAITNKQANLDLRALLDNTGISADKPMFCTKASNPPFDKGELAETMVHDTLPAIIAKTGGEFVYSVRNIHRSIGARISGEIAKRHGNLGMEQQPIILRLTGTAGQSLGVWNAGGLHIYLQGDANDYVGKGMTGGLIAVYPQTDSQFIGRTSPIIGNTCLYGATGGCFYAAGMAGERFGIRNSGAVAIVEGIGDHGCEYMTGGVVIVLGETGLNFGAGMTGGYAFVLDENRAFVDRYNHEFLDIHRITPDSMRGHVDYLIHQCEDFVAATDSVWGRELLANFSDYAGKFWFVKPKAADMDGLLNDLINKAA